MGTYNGCATKAALEAFAISPTVIPRSRAPTEPRAKSPTCSTTVAHATAATTGPKPCAPAPSIWSATTPAQPAAIERDAVHISHRAYGARKSHRRLAKLTTIAANGP